MLQGQNLKMCHIHYHFVAIDCTKLQQLCIRQHGYIAKYALKSRKDTLWIALGSSWHEAVVSIRPYSSCDIWPSTCTSTE